MINWWWILGISSVWIGSGYYFLFIKRSNNPIVDQNFQRDDSDVITSNRGITVNVTFAPTNESENPTIKQLADFIYTVDGTLVKSSENKSDFKNVAEIPVTELSSDIESFLEQPEPQPLPIDDSELSKVNSSLVITARSQDLVDTTKLSLNMFNNK